MGSDQRVLVLGLMDVAVLELDSYTLALAFEQKAVAAGYPVLS